MAWKRIRLPGSSLVCYKESMLTAKPLEARSDLSIRPLYKSDEERVRYICGRTGSNGLDTRGQIPEDGLIAVYFSDPYLHYVKGLCFGLESAQGLEGYILGVNSTKEFNTWMNTKWLLAARKRYPPKKGHVSDLESFLLNSIHQDCELPEFCEAYPAHLHIDILPEFQGQGWGRKLMEVFLERLRAEGCPGVHLAVGEANIGAQAYYKALNFSLIKKVSGAVFLGQSL